MAGGVLSKRNAGILFSTIVNAIVLLVANSHTIVAGVAPDMTLYIRFSSIATMQTGHNLTTAQHHLSIHVLPWKLCTTT